MKKNNKTNSKAWSNEDRQRFADRDFVRSTVIQGKRYEGPHADEWADDDDLWDY